MPLDVDGEESPTAGDALEFLFALVIERDARTSYEVFDGGGDEDLPGCSESRDSRTDVHGHAGDVLAADLELTGVESSADVDAQSSEGVANGDGAVDGSSRSVEGGHEFISDRVDFLTTETLQLAAHGPVVAVNVSDFVQSSFQVAVRRSKVKTAPGAEVITRGRLRENVMVKIDAISLFEMTCCEPGDGDVSGWAAVVNE